ncbi:MAG: tyrosine-type recombinase/integrase [Rhodospirillaceae bacterium]
MKALINQKLLSNLGAVLDGRRKVTVTDTRAPGLALEVRRGGATYYYRKKRFRRAHFVRLGRADELSLDDARRKAIELHAEIGRSGTPQAEPERPRLTVAQFIERHYLPHVKLRKKSAAEDARMLQRRILPAWGHRSLSDLRSGEVQAMIDGIVAEGCRPATANRFLALVRHLYNLAVQWELAERNPAKGIQQFREPSGRERYLTRDEIAALVQAVDADPDPIGAAAVLFLLLTGARLGEVLTVRWSDIDLATGAWCLPDTKSGRPLDRPLSAVAVALLQRLPRLGDDAPVFLDPRTRTFRKDLRAVWDRARKAARLANVRLHDLRHTYASILVTQGTPIYTVQRLLGHSSPVVTQKYAHLDRAHLSAATGIVSEYVQDIHRAVDAA